ncbi:MAG: germination protein GerC family [Bacilli bacterium]|nr:germination protein GerC family [Bacilli bacterium]
MNTLSLRKMIRILLVLLFYTSTLPLSGCWDRMEVNDLALITGASIDKKQGKNIELSVQVFIPRSAGSSQGMGAGGGGGGGGGSSSGQTLVRSAEGVTVADAMSKLQEKFPRRIFWGHDEVFIISEELAKAGIRDRIEFMMRYPQVREGAFIFVSKNKAKDMLELIPPLERSSSEVIRESAKSKIAMKVTLMDLMQRLSGDARAVSLPWIEELPPDPGKDEKQSIPYISGTAVFKKDKLVGHINYKQTRGVLWLRNEIELAIVTVAPKEAEGFVSLNLLRSHTQLIPKIENGTWKMTIKAETEDDIVQNTTTLDFMNPKFSKMLEKELEAGIENNIREALDQVQKKMKADIFGFADAFHRKYPKEWNKVKERWDEVFPTIEISFDIKAHVRRPGKSTVPAGLPEKEVKEK